MKRKYQKKSGNKKTAKTPKTTKQKAGVWQKKLFLLGALGLGGFFLIGAFNPQSTFQAVKTRLLLNQKDFDARLELVAEYQKQNQFEKAAEELQEFNFYTDQLTDEQWKKLASLWSEQKRQDPAEIRKEVENWEKIVQQYPNYRDGFLKIANLWQQLGEEEKAREAQQKALALDPNYPLKN